MCPYFLCGDGILHIAKYLNKCESIQDLYYITIFLDNLDILLTKDLMTVHKANMKLFLPRIDPQNNLKELLMVWNTLNFLTLNQIVITSLQFQILKFYRKNMLYKNSRIMRNILLLMGNELPKMSSSDLAEISVVKLLNSLN